MNAQTKRYKHWPDFVRDYKVQDITHQTEVLHEIVIEKESVPIIFIPGIMGTRLADSQGELVWNPNNSIGLAWTYFWKNPAQMKSYLMDRKTHVVGQNVLKDKVMPEDSWYAKKIGVHLINSDAPETWDWVPADQHSLLPRLAWVETAATLVTQQGWGQIVGSFYRDVLMDLSRRNALFLCDPKDTKKQHCNPAYSKIFQTPVYAFGYNWVCDNADAGKLLAQHIQDVIDHETGPMNRWCEKVILISHSMGGLVTRSALKGMGDTAATKVLGVIHGAQPALGAPICYRRIRGGFEDAQGGLGVAIGETYDDVLPILANCVGGLELLPTNQYKTNSGEPKWLQGWDHNTQLAALPDKDVYTSIYSDQNEKNFFRLVFHPEGMVPGASGKANSKDTVSKAQATLINNVGQAGSFHDTLAPGGNPWQFSPSYHMYSTDVATMHRLRWDFAGDVDPNHAIARVTAELAKPDPDYDSLVDAGADYDQHLHRTGGGTDVDPTYHRDKGGAYFTIAKNEPKAGDGTVPISSGSALVPGGTGSYEAKGDKQHGAFYTYSDVREKTAYYVRQLLERQKANRLR